MRSKILKSFATLFLISLSHTAFSQIPNNDFENWSQLTAEKPSKWNFGFGYTKSTDKRSGNYAVKIQGDSDDESAGVVLLGFSEDGTTFTGGAPFAARPDSVILWAKYNIISGDSALIYLQLKKSGAPVAAKWYQIAGSSATYRRLAFKIDYLNSTTPDSIIMGIVSTNPFDEPDYRSWIMADDISFSGTSQNVPDPGFEDWKTLVHFTPNQWAPGYDELDLSEEIKPTVLRSFNAGTGGACIHVRNVMHDGDLNIGETRTYRNADEPWNWGPAFPVSARHDTLFCLYKWLPKNEDACQIGITMWKNGQTVGSGTFSSSDEQSEWKIAAIPINYFSSEIPDSCQITLNSFTFGARGESELFVDNLNFSRIFGASLKKPFQVSFSLKPNPAVNSIQISLPGDKPSGLARIFDASGREVQTAAISNLNSSIDISNLPSGTYLVKVDGFFGSRRLIKN